MPATEVIALPAEMRSIEGHRLWADDVSPAEDPAGFFDRVVGYRQVTDAWLLTLAHRRGSRIATFDRGLEELAGTEGARLVESIP